MKKNSALLLTTLVFSTFVAFGQKKAPEKSNTNGAAYNNLVAKVKACDITINFGALRIDFTKTETYSPYGGDRDAQQVASVALGQKKYKDAIKSPPPTLPRTRNSGKS